ncbi:MAG: SDR family oxidoreductase [Actinomycetota bacterium]
MTMYLVTGALGNVGSHVVQELLDRDVGVRTADIAPEALKARFGGTQQVHLDLNDSSTFSPALEGVSKVFLVRPPAISRVGPTLNRLIDHAAQAGVEAIVFSSVAGADTNTIIPHHRVETHLKESRLAWTILRPGFFAQNIESAYRQDIVEDDRIYVPAADGKVAFIDARDIAAVAALALTDPSHEMKEYHLTGPQAVTFHRVAEILSGQLDRDISYEPASVAGYFTHLLGQGLGVPHALIQTILHAGLRRGDAEPVTNTVTELLGRPPTSLEQYVDDSVHVWRTAKDG